MTTAQPAAEPAGGPVEALAAESIDVSPDASADARVGVLDGRPLETPWRRLSIRMLAVHPVIELIRALPAIVALVLVGSQRENGEWWGYFGVGIPVVIGLVRWATTRYRITPTQIQVSRGLLGRSVRTVPRDRVRSVDLTSHLMHRLLGLTRVAVGTGQVDRQKESGLVLDGLSTQDAARLREELLHSRGPAARAATTASTLVAATAPAVAAGTATDPAATAPAAAAGTVTALAATPAPARTAETTLARLDPVWIRYGPFTMSGVVSIGVLATFAWRTINEAHLNPDKFGPFHAVTSQLGGLPVAGAVIEVALLALILVAASSTVAYVLAFWNFRLTRTSSGTLHVSRGLLTTRSTTIEERRLRGVEISESLPLRAVGAARCMAITTGLRYGRGAERGGSLLLPPAPLVEARRVAALVLRDGAPLTVQLTPHSRAAARRRFTRALLGGAVPVALAGLLSWQVGQLGWVIAVAVLVVVSAPPLARDRFRSLGHAVVDGRVVFRVGSLVRRRYVIDSDGVIGWKIRQSFFQRRAGLVTLTAVTAAGRQHYGLPDVDLATAVDLADTTVPGLLEPFLVRQGVTT